MSAKDNGGPAFPVLDREWEDGTPHYVSFGGMALRDYFAAKAMQALITKGADDVKKRGPQGVPLIATFAYEYADAMIKARQS